MSKALDCIAFHKRHTIDGDGTNDDDDDDDDDNNNFDCNECALIAWQATQDSSLFYTAHYMFAVVVQFFLLPSWSFKTLKVKMPQKSVLGLFLFYIYIVYCLFLFFVDAVAVQYNNSYEPKHLQEVGLISNEPSEWTRI